ncbi:hypothetical protein ACWGLP_20905 [Streptomyces lydicus]
MPSGRRTGWSAARVLVGRSGTCAGRWGRNRAALGRSCLDTIESEFAALRHFALNGTDHRSHGEQNAAITAYIRWRNARAEPKTGFVPDSPIRIWAPYPDRAA